MVTSNKVPEEKVVKMEEPSNCAVVPQRTLLGEVNEHITCPLCRGYYIDATTIVECLHSFCRSCIIKHLQIKSYCPVCEMMINSAKPNIKLDKALQDIVYKLVPGLFQKEMERRQQFYASRPGPAATATPEQRGEDTERIIFSPEDVISFSLEYADITDADSISSKSSDSNEPQTSSTTRRYLQCPAVVNISHLKKFLSMKFDIDSTHFAIDILYKRVPLPDYYTLMDIAYIYNWKRNEPMRFFYQIIDYIAIRNRLFEVNRKSSHFPDRKASPTSTEDTNVSSPAIHLNEHGSEASSGTDSPMPDENNMKKTELSKKTDVTFQHKDLTLQENSSSTVSSLKKNDDEVEKSQFLNSFELTAKSNCPSVKTSPTKSNKIEPNTTIDVASKSSPKIDDTLKRKHHSPLNIPEIKKIKVELEKTKVPNSPTVSSPVATKSSTFNKMEKPLGNSDKLKEVETLKCVQTTLIHNSTTTSSSIIPLENKQEQQGPVAKQQGTDSPGFKRSNLPSQNTSSPKRKTSEMSTAHTSSLGVKAVSPLKLQIPKVEAPSLAVKSAEPQKAVVKKMPELKPSIPVSTSSSQNKTQPINKVRMDLLANNSDPTIDRSKILSQVKSSLSIPGANQSTSGDPLKSLFDSCKINIPSSLSITLTDQKLENRSPSDSLLADQKKNMINKNLTNASNISTHKVPSPPVHNYIEILKLPDTESKKANKTEGHNDGKVNLLNKTDSNALQAKSISKSSETSAKGPVPNLKPIADTKLGKQSGNFSSPITFQQTFEQQLQSMQSDKKTKLPKNKAQVPKLVPATPKTFSVVNKFNNSNNKTISNSMPSLDTKPNAALDLSTQHNVQSQLGPQQTKAFETMQSIANLAKKQNLPSKGLPLPTSQSNVFPNMSNRTTTTGTQPLRVPSSVGINTMKMDKMNTCGTSSNNTLRQDMSNSSKITQNKQSNNSSPSIQNLGYPITSHISPSTAQPSPRSQTRSPSSSPKLVIAEEKQSSNSLTEHNINQSNQITSTQLSNMNFPKSESPKASPGPSKPLKPLVPPAKIPGIRQPVTPVMKSNPGLNSPAEYIAQSSLLSAHPGITHLLRHQMEMQNAWIKAQRQYDLLKNMTSIGQQSQSDFSNKDKQ